MEGDGLFLWFREGASKGGFRTPPKAGFCVSVFVCLWRGEALLLGKYGQHEAWMDLAGLDPERVQRYSVGWTLPGTHLKLGEDPRQGATRVLTDLLGLDPASVELSEPLVASSYGPHNHPDIKPLGDHFDLWFFSQGTVETSARIEAPPWYHELTFVDPGSLGADEYGREHQDVVEAMLDVRAGPRPVASGE